MLFGIEEIGTQLEEPFTVLPMQAFCDKIYNWCMEIVSWAPGDSGRPMKYQLDGVVDAAPAQETSYDEASCVSFWDHVGVVLALGAVLEWCDHGVSGEGWEGLGTPFCDAWQEYQARQQSLLRWELVSP